MKNQQTVRRLIQNQKGLLAPLALSLFFSAISVVATLLIPVLAGRAIDAIEPGGVAFARLKAPLFGILLCAGAAGLFNWITGRLNNRIAYRAVRDLRNRAFERLQRLPVSYLDSAAVGDTVSRVVNDAEQVSDGLILGFSQLFTGALTILITLVLMLKISVVIAMAVVVMTPLSLFTARLIASKTYRLFRRQSESKGEQTALINEMIGNQKTVQAFCYEPRAAERFDRTNARLHKDSLKAVFYSSLTNPVTRFINNIIYAAVALLGACVVLKGGMTVGAFVSFLAYATQYTKPFNEISGVMTELQNAFACADRVLELADLPPERDDERRELQDVKGNVRFDKVAFSYDPANSLIQNLTFSAGAGQKIAIVGPTGCGKTTLINLLLRFYEPNDGSILVDGMDIAAVTRQSLRRNFGMVLQETWIMNGTVKENIAFGKPHATMREIVDAAVAARADGFIRRLPNGYDTVLGENDGLSEGERQLLCIARVMLIKPPILILDEATSSIDTRTEVNVQQAFSNLMEGRTSFVVAHRLSTVRDADCILVMKDGIVFEQGTHEELLAKNGFYAELYNSQFAGGSF